ncbi:MAG: response regulator [Archangium sp.]|nr:response regulator [Archangium sp.]MDP3155903.1 response regulator [Archangium sp.]MDP3574415.1 response regulator [Archangium sp.]
MGPEVLSHIFDPFFTTKERGRGTGLGLATVDAAVRAHDGEISVLSRPGQGTTFQLRLPLIAGVIETRPAGSDVVKPKGGELLLIVDDELLVRQALVPLLERLGYRVVEARSGAEALETLSTVKPALMILDLVMPGSSAVDTFRTARQMIPGLPVLFCSGFAPEALLSTIQSEPHTARLAKPFSTQDLLTAVRSLLS